jgi:fructose-specific phosphotransferase system IIA component
MKLNLKKLLCTDTVFLDLRADTKEGVIEEMISGLADSGRIKNRDAALKAVLDRERKMATGMEHGIAIPHGKTDGVDQLVTAIARKKGGVDFNAMDRKASTIFIMTVSPVSRSGPHIQFLAEVSKLLKDPEARKKILEAKTKEDIIRVFC